GHRRATENIDVGNDTTPCQPIPEPPERLFDRLAIKKRIVETHATSSSWAATYTPRRRNAAGAWTTASTRAARVLNGNQNRRNDRDSAQDGAPRPSRAARCSANAARNTSHRSSPVPAGSSANSPKRVADGSQRYSSRNSATNRHRSDSRTPVSSFPKRATVSGWYATPPSRSATLRR